MISKFNGTSTPKGSYSANKIIRSIFNANYNDHTNEFFVQLNILKLDIARHQSGIFMFKFINGNLPRPLSTVFNYNYDVPRAISLSGKCKVHMAYIDLNT